MDLMDKMYCSLLQIQMTASDVLDTLNADPEQIVLYDGIVQHMQAAAEKAADILEEYLDDVKSAKFTRKIAFELRDHIDYYNNHPEEF